MANRTDSRLMNAAGLFGVLAEPARLRILQLLRDGARCGRELASDLNLTPATTCHHLDKLKMAKLLSERRAGRRVYYSLSESELNRAVEQSLAMLQDVAVNGKHVRAGRQKPQKQVVKKVTTSK